VWRAFSRPANNRTNKNNRRPFPTRVFSSCRPAEGYAPRPDTVAAFMRLCFGPWPGRKKTATTVSTGVGVVPASNEKTPPLIRCENDDVSISSAIDVLLLSSETGEGPPPTMTRALPTADESSAGTCPHHHPSRRRGLYVVPNTAGTFPFSKNERSDGT